MSQLTFSAVPGFFDLADSAIAGNQPLTDDSLQKISHNAKFAAVRCEMIYMGFYGSGDTVPVPVSPVDGYAYSRGECMFIPVFASSRQPAPGFIPGQDTFPALSNVDLGSGGLVVVPYVVDISDATGFITCQVFFTTGGAQSQGTVKVYAVCQRSSLNQNN
ncbi:MAG TPA: hypothetical protein VFZ08_02005 [Terriglobia bacterium]|nr:hypothetical protein [Terriglobia bacterium]